MRYKILTLLLFTIPYGAPLGISSKLDFGDAQSSPAIIGHPNRPSSIRQDAAKKHDSGFETIGIVCVSGGCNSTASKSESKDSIETDVVVHVKTSVGLNKSKEAAPVRDTPDVPIVVGLGGTAEAASRTYNEPPLIVTDLGSIEPQVTDFGSISGPTFQYSGSTGSSYPSLSAPTYPNSGSTASLYPSISSHTYPGSSYPSLSAPTYSESSYPSLSAHMYPNFGSSKSNYPSVTGSGYPNFGSIASSFPASSFVTSRDFESAPNADLDRVFIEKSDEPRVDINIKTLPPVTITMNEDGYIKDFGYKANGIEVHVPYFEPTFNNHYFGEHPPPQRLWYPKKPGTLNPVEFKSNPSATWKPSLWTGVGVGVSHKHPITQTDPPCDCRKTNGVTRGLQWNPNRRTSTSNQDPGSQINDKLAPLN